VTILAGHRSLYTTDEVTGSPTVGYTVHHMLGLYMHKGHYSLPKSTTTLSMLNLAVLYQYVQTAAADAFHVN